MDIGTVECVQKGLLQIVQGEIKQIHADNQVVFLDGSSRKFDCIIWATGYHMFHGHTHIFDKGLVEKIGTGVEAIKTHRLLPGSEHPLVKGLWINYGRIQMLRDGAMGLSWKIAERLDITNPVTDPVDSKDSWTMFAAKHAAVALFISASRRFTSSKL